MTCIDSNNHYVLIYTLHLCVMLSNKIIKRNIEHVLHVVSSWSHTMPFMPIIPIYANYAFMVLKVKTFNFLLYILV